MTVTETTTETLPQTAHLDDTRADGIGADESTDVVDEVLVEEISIDGMCGVY